MLPKRKNRPGLANRGGFNQRGANPMAMMMAFMRGMGGRGMRGAYRGGRGRGYGRGRGGDPSAAGQESK